MPEVSCHLPAENELVMPQFTIKLNTYDPATIEAFDRLRKNRKQAAFTHEALKYFLTTEKGRQVLLLMERRSTVSPSTPEVSPDADLPRNASIEQITMSNHSSVPHVTHCISVLDSILK